MKNDIYGRIAKTAALINTLGATLYHAPLTKRQIAIISAVLTADESDTELLKHLRTAAFTVRDSIIEGLPFEPD